MYQSPTQSQRSLFFYILLISWRFCTTVFKSSQSLCLGGPWGALMGLLGASWRSPEALLINWDHFHVTFFYNFLKVGDIIFKASALWADAFYKSKCLSVCPSVCSLLRYHLNVFLPPLPEIGCPIFLEIRNPWGNSNGKKWSQIRTFLFENCLKSSRKKKFFFADFASQNMGETTLPNGLGTSGQRAYR